MKIAMTPGTPDATRMHHFHTLSPEHQADALRRLAALGYSDHGIASASGLSVEFVRRVLGSKPAENGL